MSVPRKQQPKGILKKPQTSTTPAIGTTACAINSIFAPQQSQGGGDAPRELPREQQIAIQQARLLQQQLQQEIKPAVSLEIFERLSQFPPPSSSSGSQSSAYSAKNPAPADAAEFITSVAEFTPSEYLDLIEERNCVGRCGYTLCPRPRRKLSGEFKITAAGIARVEDLNKWCSDTCAARALFIKVQLDNPSFTTNSRGERVVKIELRAEKDKEPEGGEKNGQKDEATTKSSKTDQIEDEKLARDMKKLDLGQQVQKQTPPPPLRHQPDQDEKRQTAATLSAERGDNLGNLADLNTGVVKVTIREKSVTTPARPPDLPKRKQQLLDPTSGDDEDNVHLTVEGHKTTFGTGKKGKAKSGQAGEDDDMDYDDDDDYMPASIRF